MKKDDITKTETASPARRRLLKALTAGTAGGAAATLLPSQWTKPVINSALAPAHAQLSPGGPIAQTCSIPDRTTGADTTGSWAATLTSRAEQACGAIATVQLIFDGGLVGSCNAQAGGSALVSWSCSMSSSSGLAEGDTVTYVVTWDNGCACSVIDTVS